jgi:hypothetical protein
MKGFQYLLGARKHNKNKIFRLAASAVATLALAGSIHSASATPIKTTTAEEITSASTQLGETKPTVAQVLTATTNNQLIPMSPWGIIPIVVVGGFVIFVPLVFGGLVVIGEREVGIVVKKFAISGRGLPAGGLIALNGEAGLQGRYSCSWLALGLFALAVLCSQRTSRCCPPR